MAYMNDELQTAIDSNAPHYFCAWLSSLAVDYNRFYRDNYVIEEGVVNVQNLILSELARDHLDVDVKRSVLSPLRKCSAKVYVYSDLSSIKLASMPIRKVI